MKNDPADRLSSLSPARRALLEQRLRKTAAPAATPTIPRREDRRAASLSHAQERIWLLDQLMPGVSAYNVPRGLRLHGPLNVAALQRALDALVARHEVLRSVYQVVNGEPRQIVQEPGSVPFRTVDLTSWPQAEREGEGLRLLTQELRRPFNLARDSMLRAVLVQLAPADHLLLLVTHHIASDGGSRGVLLHELAALYHAFATGQPAPLSDLPLQYGDFAAWQRRVLQDGAIAKSLTYWKERLAGAPPVLELPADHPRPAVATFQGANAFASLPQPLMEELKALGRQEGVTLFMVLLAAFNALLYRYTGQSDLVVGVPVSGRSRPELQGLIGCFINTLVLRTDLSGNPTFRELLQRARSRALDAYDHQDVPVEKLVEELQAGRDLSRAPLAQVLFVFEGSAGALPSIPGLGVSPLDLDAGGAKLDFAFNVIETPERVKVQAQYSTDLFEEATVCRFLAHWQTLLEGIVADPGCRLAQLPILTPAEREQLLVGWNATAADFPRERCVHHLVEAQAARTPHAVAVACEDRQLTYAELNAQANRLAHALRRRGIGPEALVGIYVERSLEMVVGLLGVLKAGGAYLPLDPSFPSERLAFMLTDTEAPMILTQHRLLPQLPPHRAQVLCLDEPGKVLESQGDANLSGGAAPEHLAYVIYTSGSTGKPKGVQIPHAAVVNFLTSMAREPGLTAQDRLLAVTSLSFDIAGLELFLPLTVGACVDVVSREVAGDGARLRRRLEETRPTVMQATPATWRMLLDAGWTGGLAKILCGGEALSSELANRLMATGAELWNMYGPTETTIWSLVSRVEPGVDVVSLGRPIANTTVYVLDAHMQPVPVGVPGELYLGGTGLARGYLRRPELTAERFIRHPFDAQPEARLYRTGDLVRYPPDGTLQFLGRIDHQVKVHGFRIELGDIEAVLVQHAAVKETVVVAREDSPGDKRLVAYLVPTGLETPAASELRRFLREQLPEYMVPSAFVTLTALPLTPNGKVNRLALPAPEQTRPELEEAFVAPRTPAEETIAAIWAELLRVSTVGVRDNFFGLGGNSLLATRVMARLRDAFQVELPLRSLFEAPTVEGLTLAVTAARAAQQDAERLQQLLEQAMNLQ
jgi:amino acid adenylation domain-containing protein